MYRSMFDAITHVMLLDVLGCSPSTMIHPKCLDKSSQVFAGLGLVKPAEFAECRTAMKGWWGRLMTITPHLMKLINESRDS